MTTQAAASAGGRKLSGKAMWRMSALLLWLFGVVAMLPVAAAQPAESGLITKPSNNSARETVRRFREAVESKGWKFYAEIDHAAAARDVDWDMNPNKVLVFGFPEAAARSIKRAPTLGIDNPLKALVWQDGQGKVWLTYNSAAYLLLTIYPRHGLPTPPEDGVTPLERDLAEIAKDATE